MRPYRQLTIISLAALLLQFSDCQERDKSKTVQGTVNYSDNEYKIVGYVAGGRDLDFSTIQAEKLTHINYAFANCVDGVIRFGPETHASYDPSPNIKDLVNLRKLKTKNPNLKILISVGGWSWSKNFSDAALTEESREKFAATVMAFIKEHQLDGVDIDWEYPGQIGAGNVFRSEDKQNFTLLLKKVREYLEVESTKEGRKGTDRYLLTIATGADQKYIDNTDLGEAHKYLDFINIMTYDFHTGSNPITGHLANLFPSDMPGTTNRSVDKAVRIHIDAGVPARKIVLGIPFYGRMWSGVSPVNNGLYQKSEPGDRSVPFSKIKTDFTEENGFVKHTDETAVAVYLFNQESKTFVTFDDLSTMKRKLDYVKEKHLAGVMFWEYSHDVNSELLSTIFEGLK